jgi:hypothetical protein
VNEVRLLALMDQCVAAARYVNEPEDEPVANFGSAGSSSSALTSVGFFRHKPIHDSIVLPAALWSQLVTEILPMTMSAEPGDTHAE